MPNNVVFKNLLAVLIGQAGILSKRFRDDFKNVKHVFNNKLALLFPLFDFRHKYVATAYYALVIMPLNPLAVIFSLSFE